MIRSHEIDERFILTHDKRRKTIKQVHFHTATLETATTEQTSATLMPGCSDKWAVDWAM